MRMGSMSVVVVFSSFLLFFSGGPGGLSPPEGRFPPPAPDMFTSPARDKTGLVIQQFAQLEDTKFSNQAFIHFLSASFALNAVPQVLAASECCS